MRATVDRFEPVIVPPQTTFPLTFILLTLSVCSISTSRSNITSSLNVAPKAEKVPLSKRLSFNIKSS